MFHRASLYTDRMVVRIRLQRFGRHDRPFYRIVAADARAKRDGKFLEMLGSYNPIASRDGIKEVRLKGDRIKYWLSVGAQPSDRVSWLLSKYNVLPVAPLRPTTVQHLPRKERKELAAEGGKKQYHTSTAAYSLSRGLVDAVVSGLGFFSPSSSNNKYIGAVGEGGERGISLPGVGSLGVGRLITWARASRGTSEAKDASSLGR